MLHRVSLTKTLDFHAEKFLMNFTTVSIKNKIGFNERSNNTILKLKSHARINLTAKTKFQLAHANL